MKGLTTELKEKLTLKQRNHGSKFRNVLEMRANEIVQMYDSFTKKKLKQV
jgi:hypothetical protein